MLDLMTLGFSMGLNNDLQKMREETGATGTCNNDENLAEAEANMATDALEFAADAVGGVVNTFENAVTVTADALIPSWTMVESVVECVPTAPTVDLSLPTAPTSKK